MKSKTVKAFLFLFVAYFNLLSKDEDFERFFLKHFKRLNTSFSVKDHLRLDKNYSQNDFLSIDKDVFLSGYLKENGKKEIGKSIFMKYKLFPIFYLEKNSSVILCYDRIQRDRYGVGEYQCWLKSFNKKGEAIDSIKIAHIADYEGIALRSFSILNNQQNIELEYFEKNLELNQDNTISTEVFSVDVSFRISDSGVFHISNEDNNSVVFKTDYGYYSIKEIFKLFHNSCLVANSFLRGDFDGDGNIDLIYLTFDHCKKYYSDLILSLGNYQGFFAYGGSLGGVNLDSRKHTLLLVQIKDQILTLELGKTDQTQKVRLYFSLNRKKRLCSLNFVDVITSKGDKRVVPPKPNIYLAQGILFAKTILDDEP